MTRRLSGTPTERIDKIVARSFPRERIEAAITRARELAPDPEFGIDCDRPDDSGIGRAPREADFSARAMCRTAHHASEERGVLVGLRTPASIVGALLEHMSPESAAELLRIAERTARAIAEDERPKQPEERAEP